MKLLFIFLDGVGLGVDDPQVNPFARASLPGLQNLLGGQRLVSASAPFNGEKASLLPLDASLGVTGLPQSATGQAALLTGRNVPMEVNEHYGPKPNEKIRNIINSGNIFQSLTKAGKKCALLNAYPPRYFHGIERGHRLYSAIPQAVTSAGLPLFTEADFFGGRGMSADFTGEGWRSMLGYSDAPLYTAREAGAKLAALAEEYDFSMFEYWASDYTGHGQEMDKALELLATLDGVLAGLVEAMPEDLLVLITSDHGNLEDLSTRRHTLARVPGLLLGERAVRDAFSAGLTDLTGIAGRMERAVMGGL